MSSQQLPPLSSPQRPTPDTAGPVTQAANPLAAHYQRLPSKTCTRLLVLQPGHREDSIQCTIEVVDLNDNPRYIAISYTWGDASDEAEILVDGHTATIRQNLFDCLQTMRNRNTALWLWIDALSISQSNIPEKSQQVAMIGRIFSQAIEVRAWVGKHADNSECLFRDEDLMKRWCQSRLIALKTYLRKLLFVFMAFWFPISILGFTAIVVAVTKTMTLVVLVGFLPAVLAYLLQWRVNHRWIRAGLSDIITKPAVHEYAVFLPAFNAFMKRPYWQRKWIVQEISLARKLTIWCGSDSMPWSQFVTRFLGFELGPGTGAGSAALETSSNSAWKAFEKKQMQAKVFVMDFFVGKEISHLFRLAFVARHQLTILELAFLFGYTACHLRHDVVYALLAMEKEHSGEEIAPDYNMEVVDIAVRVLQARLPEQQRQTEREETVHKLVSLLDLTGDEMGKVHDQLGGIRVRTMARNLLNVDFYRFIPIGSPKKKTTR